MGNNYEEIYDQAGFFSEVWDQLPEEFTKGEKPISPWGTALTSHSMVFIDFSEEKQHCLNMECLSENVEIEDISKDTVMVKCKDCGHNLTRYK